MQKAHWSSTSRWRRLLEHEATGGLLLAAAAVIAILFVNLGLSDVYHDILNQDVTIGIGKLALQKSFHHAINDGLMAIFFFLVGLEIKREMMEGSLSNPSEIVLPAVAALGGIMVPSGIYAVLNWGNPATMAGWAIPSATDIAFALGALALAGSRVPASLKLFLLTLATFDDLAAIIIIALFYTSELSTLALSGAASCIVVLFLLNRFRITSGGTYVLVGLVMWFFVLKSGVHATLAGVTLGLFIPLRRDDGSSLLHEFEHSLQPYVKYLILPLFAFANAGLPLDGFSFHNMAASVPSGIALGLVIGKPVGVMLSCLLLTALGWARLPRGATWRHMLGVGCLAGIGFTMSLFIGSLAFSGAEMEKQVRVGVISGTLVSIVIGLAILLTSRPIPGEGKPPQTFSGE